MADLSITAASVRAGAGADIEHGYAGATITQGQLVYKEAATGLFKLSDSNSATAEVKAVYGIALNAASANQPLAVQKSGEITIGATLVAGSPYYLSETPGGIEPGADLAAGEEVVSIGYAKTTAILTLRIQDTGVTL